MASSSVVSQPPNLETFILVWLDRLVNVSQENIDTKLLLRKAINQVKTFEDAPHCIEYIHSRSRERIVLIVSGRFGHEIIPRIHQYPQLVAVYVYCADKKRNEDLAKRYIKVKGVITDLKELIAKIQYDQAKRNEYKIDEPLPMSVFYAKSNDNNTKKQTVAINNNDFLYFQLLIDCLSRMKTSSTDRKELIALCKEEYKGNDSELSIVKEFKDGYTPERAIWWFTRESFVCRMLNKAFQIINIDLLYTFHFVIRDIRKQLKDMKFSTPIRTYRAQLLSIKEVKLLKSSIGELISINTFLLTIPSRERAMNIFKDSGVIEDVKQVLFEIDADPKVHDVKPFADITSLNYFNANEVILFMAGTIFRPIDIQTEKNGIIIIQMETCSDSDQRIKSTLDDLKSDYYDDETNLLLLGHILIKMKQFEHAEKCYNRLLTEMPNDHNSVAACYRGLSQVAIENGDFNTSIHLLQKALQIDQSILRAEDPEIATAYNNIGNVYILNGSYGEAHEAFNEALKIWIRSLGKDHPKVGQCYKHIAHAFEKEQRYFEAVDSYKKALAVRERNSSADHPDVAKLHNQIGAAYVRSGDANQALKHHNIALDIFMNAYSDQHPDVLSTMRDIGLAHEAAGNFNQAKRQFEKILMLRRQILSPNHPDIAQLEHDLKRVSASLKKH